MRTSTCLNCAACLSGSGRIRAVLAPPGTYRPWYMEAWDRLGLGVGFGASHDGVICNDPGLKAVFYTDFIVL